MTALTINPALDTKPNPPPTEPRTRYHLTPEQVQSFDDNGYLIVEPDMKGRRDLVEVDGVQIQRISTRMPPHDMMFCIEYAQAARRVYRSFAPDLLVTLNAGVLPPLLLEARRPAAVV